jgi:antibiotic biosynthesis monooxygenase (ABM) superfamily enzyme
VIYKFASLDALKGWEESDAKQRLTAIANLFTLGEPRYEILSGLETCFTVPAPAGFRPPHRGRMTLVTWLGIFPLVFIYGQLLAWLLPFQTPALLHVTGVTLLVVPTMTYVVAPRLTRLFKGWLYPTNT